MRQHAAPTSAIEPGRSADQNSARLAGAEGLEPPTFGFGDRRSTN